MNTTKLRENILNRWERILTLDRNIMVTLAIDEMLNFYNIIENKISIYCNADKELSVKQIGHNAIEIKVKELK